MDSVLGSCSARGLVTLHGGSVEAHSDGAGTGSEFIVRLPIGTPLGEMPEIESAEQSFVSGAGLKILVVDDNRDAADSCAALLELSGHHVQTAYTGLMRWKSPRPSVLTRYFWISVSQISTDINWRRPFGPPHGWKYRLYCGNRLGPGGGPLARIRSRLRPSSDKTDCSGDSGVFASVFGSNVSQRRVENPGARCTSTAGRVALMRHAVATCSVLRRGIASRGWGWGYTQNWHKDYFAKTIC